MELHSILKEAIGNGASDVFVIPGLPLTYKVKGVQERTGASLNTNDTASLVDEIYRQSGRTNRVKDDDQLDDDFSFSIDRKSVV